MMQRQAASATNGSYQTAWRFKETEGLSPPLVQVLLAIFTYSARWRLQDCSLAPALQDSTFPSSVTSYAVVGKTASTDAVSFTCVPNSGRNLSVNARMDSVVASTTYHSSSEQRRTESNFMVKTDNSSRKRIRTELRPLLLLVAP